MTEEVKIIFEGPVLALPQRAKANENNAQETDPYERKPAMSYIKKAITTELNDAVAGSQNPTCEAFAGESDWPPGHSTTLDDFEALLEEAERITKISRLPDHNAEPAVAASRK